MCNPLVVGGALGLGSTLVQSKAADKATDVARDTADQQTALYRDIYNQQVQLNEPFRQADIQRQNMLLELFGGDPVGQSQAGQPANALSQYAQSQPDYAAYVNNSSGLSNALRTLSAPNQQYIANQGFDRNGNGQIDPAEFGEFHYVNHGQQEQRTLPMISDSTPGNNYVGTAAIAGGNALAKQPVQDVITTANGAANDTGGLAPTVDPSVNGAERFNNSLFNAAFTNNFNRDRDRIDNALAGSGLQFSGARMNAVENSRAQNFGNALSNYTNLLAGFPTTSQATNAMTSAAGAYGANTSNALGNAGNAAMQSAYARGNALASGIGDIAYGIGRSFSIGGKK